MLREVWTATESVRIYGAPGNSTFFTIVRSGDTGDGARVLNRKQEMDAREKEDKADEKNAELASKLTRKRAGIPSRLSSNRPAASGSYQVLNVLWRRLQFGVIDKLPRKSPSVIGACRVFSTL